MILKIAIHGCDDSTVFMITADEKEHQFLKKVADLSTETSTYGCMPTMVVEVLPNSDQNDKTSVATGGASSNADDPIK